MLDPQGRFLRAFGSQGTADGKFNYPWGVTTDALGFIYVCDKENHRVQVRRKRRMHPFRPGPHPFRSLFQLASPSSVSICMQIFIYAVGHAESFGRRRGSSLAQFVTLELQHPAAIFMGLTSIYTYTYIREYISVFVCTLTAWSILSSAPADFNLQTYNEYSHSSGFPIRWFLRWQIRFLRPWRGTTWASALYSRIEHESCDCFRFE